MSSSLVLGCAQLGLNYGIANTIGKPSEEQAFGLVEAALENGIDTFDTAQAYGDSEQVLGRVLKKLNVCGEVKIITKISPALDIKKSESIRDAVNISIDSLEVERLHCIMLHRAETIPEMDGRFGDVLKEFCRQGKVEKLGVSLYSVEEAKVALAHNDLDFIQLPDNIWDNRMVEAGVFEAAERRGKKIFVRSIFLQGLLLMSPAEVAVKLPFAYEAALEWNKIADEFGISRHQLALAGGKKMQCPLVIGAETPDQIRENADIFRQLSLTDTILAEIKRRMQPLINEQILNPSKW